jgi:hypothetical protein
MSHLEEVFMKNTTEGLLAEIEKILDGIDRQETDDETGWWETSHGADFGRERLILIRQLFSKAVEPAHPIDVIRGVLQQSGREIDEEALGDAKKRCDEVV